MLCTTKIKRRAVDIHHNQANQSFIGAGDPVGAAASLHKSLAPETSAFGSNRKADRAAVAAGIARSMPPARPISAGRQRVASGSSAGGQGLVPPTKDDDDDDMQSIVSAYSVDGDGKARHKCIPGTHPQ